MKHGVITSLQKRILPTPLMSPSLNLVSAWWDIPLEEVYLYVMLVINNVAAATIRHERYT